MNPLENQNGGQLKAGPCAQVKEQREVVSCILFNSRDGNNPLSGKMFVTGHAHYLVTRKTYPTTYPPKATIL